MRACISLFKHKELSWTFLVGLAFLIVYLASLTFVYVEGDDAFTIAFHLLGRNRELQPPYYGYYGMMNVVLRIFPAQEAVLRIGSILLTSVSTVILVILLLVLTFDWIGDVAVTQKWLMTGMLLLAALEFFYLGLIYSPPMFAYCFTITAHLILRQAFRTTGLPGIINPESRLAILLSPLFFGFSVACCWPVLAYGAVIFKDLVIGNRKPNNIGMPPLRKRLTLGVIWGAVALLAATAGTAISGYGLEDILEFSKSIQSVIHQTQGSDTLPLINFRTVYRLISLFTPAFTLLSAVGFIELARRRDPRVLVVVIGGLGVLPAIPSDTPKLLMAAVPGLMLCFAVGLVALWDGIRHPRLRLAVRIVVVSLAVVPWLVGTRATRENSAWGPGYELRPYDFRETTEGLDFAPTIGAGRALPTIEGARPFFGHAYVLLGGQWRQLYVEAAQDRHRAIEQAVSRNLPLLSVRWSDSLITNELVALGFSTSDPYGRLHPDNHLFLERRFIDDEGRQVILLYREIGLGTLDDLEVISNVPAEEVVFYSPPLPIRHIHELAPSALQKLGSTSAVLDLNCLRRQLDSLPD